MGGKTWSREEELYFWRTIVPMSPKAAVESASPVEWSQLAVDMQQHFGTDARRTYTSLMLYEHYFQNITTRHFSPRSVDLVREHIRQLVANGRDPEEVAKSGQRPKRPAKRKAPAASTAAPAASAASNNNQPPTKKPAIGLQSPSAGPVAQIVAANAAQARAPPAASMTTSHAGPYGTGNAYTVPRQQYYPPVIPVPGSTHSHPAVAFAGFRPGNSFATPQVPSARSNAYAQNAATYTVPTTYGHGTTAFAQGFFNEVNWGNSTGQDSGYASGASSNHAASPTSPAPAQDGSSAAGSGYPFFPKENA
ncbi:Chitinase 1 [Purpureocillium lavendulum]|uniref:Chitinase 1 n=1 Tax=Purpureocillium lavendulum TaxID=1247861 RepID=A0AB34FHR4_9HYPO|nr:Chitinase 1 [Purpureocillium lavendulum]